MPLVHMADVVVAGVAGGVSATFSQFARAAAPAAVMALWQGGLVALALVLCLRFVLRVPAAQRFLAWGAGFAAAATLPLLPPLERFGAAIAATRMSGAGTRPWLELDSRWGLAIGALWLAASGFRAAEIAFDLLRLRRLWRDATPVAAGANLRGLLAAALPSRHVEICTTCGLDRPSVIGFFAPRILVPEWLYSRLTQGELEQVVMHEAEHLRRRDDWTNLLQKLFLVVFPLNPALAWMERRLCREREMACDEGVVRRTQAPRSYAACLTTLAERGLERREFLRRAQALSLGAFERRPELAQRVDSILRRKPALHPLVAGTLVGAMGCGLVMGALELSRSPQLVAFEAAPQMDAQMAAQTPLPNETLGAAPFSHERSGEPGPTATDAVFRPSERVRAVKTGAIVRPSMSRTLKAAGARPRGGDESSGRPTETAMTGADGAPADVLVKVTAQTPAESAAQGQEYIVLTAWEEVQTFSPRAKVIADYETGAGRQDQSAAATEQSGPARQTRITITRLVLVVSPANALATKATGSDSHRPTASSIGSGWLIFQL